LLLDWSFFELLFESNQAVSCYQLFTAEDANLAQCKYDVSKGAILLSCGSNSVSCQLIAEMHNVTAQYNECEVSEAISLLAILLSFALL
jgi:hypothetical protein